MKLGIKNFRSIKDQEIELAPITVVYGPNGSGKSSLIYALLSLKNLVVNPNQNSSGFFNYGFSSLGGFEEVIFDHQLDSKIELSISMSQEKNDPPQWKKKPGTGPHYDKNGNEVPNGSIIKAWPKDLGGAIDKFMPLDPIDNWNLFYQVTISRNDGEFLFQHNIGNSEFHLILPVSFPYALNQQRVLNIQMDNIPYSITWNGVTAQVQSQKVDLETQHGSDPWIGILNSHAEFLRKISVIPLKRGFSKPQYQPVSVSPLMISEDDVATMLSNEKNLVSKISYYLEKIVERDFRINIILGTTSFSFDSTDRNTGTSTLLVNDGFGVNQLVYFLAKCLHHDAGWVCVEEPEIHLHPSAIRELVRALVQIVHEEGKKFIISTHSESFISALLACVVDGKLKPDELACYLVTKDKKITSFERQTVNKKGQLEGGLSSFMDAQLEDVKSFLKVSE